MPPIQTTYADNIGPAYVGLVANMETANSITRLCQDVAGIGFGRAVFQGTGDMQGTATPGTLFKGVTISDKSLVASAGSPIDQFAQFANMALLDKGVIWVTAGASVVAGAAAYVTSAGAWTSLSSGNTAIPNATFDSTAGSGALVKLRLR